MNEQRRIVYALRDQVLEGGDMAQDAREEITAVLDRTIEDYTAEEYAEDWDLDGLMTALSAIYPVSLPPGALDDVHADVNQLIELVSEDAARQYDAREAELGEELMRALERYLLLQIIDERWREHLYDMDYLREGIHLRGFAQIDPLVAYKNEAFTLFTDLMNTVWADFARMIFHVQVQVAAPNGGPQPAGAADYQPGGSSTRAANVTYSSGAAVGASAIGAAAAAEAATGLAENPFGGEEELPVPTHVEQRQLADDEQIGRNEPCWCGSGKKFKRCHGA
jgi:preprotein translocase subunit SecA